MTEDEYRRAIAHERALGMAYVNGLLDGLCRDLGYPAGQRIAWRRERQFNLLRRQMRPAIEAYNRATDNAVRSMIALVKAMPS